MYSGELITARDISGADFHSKATRKCSGNTVNHGCREKREWNQNSSKTYEIFVKITKSGLKGGLIEIFLSWVFLIFD